MARKSRTGASNGLWRLYFKTKPAVSTIQAKLTLASRGLLDMRPAWAELVPMLKAGVRDIVASRGELVGHPWRTLSERYAKQKKRQGQTTAELIATGKMLKGIDALLVTPGLLRFGSDAPQARAMNFGFTGKQTAHQRRGRRGGAVGNIGERPFLFSASSGTSRAIRTASRRAMQEHVDRVLSSLETIQPDGVG